MPFEHVSGKSRFKVPTSKWVGSNWKVTVAFEISKYSLEFPARSVNIDPFFLKKSSSSVGYEIELFF